MNATQLNVQVGDRIRDDEDKVGTVTSVVGDEVAVTRVGGKHGVLHISEIVEVLQPEPDYASRADVNADMVGEVATGNTPKASRKRPKAGKGAKATPKATPVARVARKRAKAAPAATPEPAPAPAGWDKVETSTEETPAPAAPVIPSLPYVEPPKGNLENRAMLARLSIGAWEARRKDKQVIEEVVGDNKAEKDAGAWWTYLVPPKALNPIYNAQSKARDVHYKYTLPWLDDGQRVLPAAMYLTYTAKMREAKEAFNKEVATFLAEYPAHVANAKQRLGTLADGVEYPTPAEAARKFSFGTSFAPLPTAGDFRVELAADMVAEIKQEIAHNTTAAMAQAVGNLWERLHKQITHIAERLGDAKGVFRDSLVKNLVELCDLLPTLNVTGNPELEAIRQLTVAKLTKVEPEVLRKNPTARTDAALAANDILKRLEGYMGGKPVADAE